MKNRGKNTTKAKKQSMTVHPIIVQYMRWSTMLCLCLILLEQIFLNFLGIKEMRIQFTFRLLDTMGYLTGFWVLSEGGACSIFMLQLCSCHCFSFVLIQQLLTGTFSNNSFFVLFCSFFFYFFINFSHNTTNK